MVEYFRGLFLIYRLQPYFENFSKRLVKQGKLYFFDTGLACRLLGIRSREELETHPLFGALFETWVIGEIQKTIRNFRLPLETYFWRDHKGLQVDLLLVTGTQLIPLEIKSSATALPELTKSLQTFMALAPQAQQPMLVYRGEGPLEVQNIRFLPVSHLETFLKTV